MSYEFNVIGIGFSAGGFDPLKEIISRLPTNLNGAVIISQHIPAEAPSHLDRILSRITSLKVVAVETIEYLEPGHIYVMAIGKAIKLNNGFVEIAERDPSEKINHTIDQFFLSLADEVKEKGIGIILSGAGYDGIEGAKAVEKENGLIIVQDPGTAEFPLMPETLIANDHPDYILTPEDIAYKVIEHLNV